MAGRVNAGLDRKPLSDSKFSGFFFTTGKILCHTSGRRDCGRISVVGAKKSLMRLHAGKGGLFAPRRRAGARAK